jgi:hypothetical protein
MGDQDRENIGQMKKEVEYLLVPFPLRYYYFMTCWGQYIKRESIDIKKIEIIDIKKFTIPMIEHKYWWTLLPVELDDINKNIKTKMMSIENDGKNLNQEEIENIIRDYYDIPIIKQNDENN